MYNQFHVGFNPTEAMAPPLTLVWTYQTGDTIVNSASVVGNKVFLKTRNNIYSLDTADGNFNWSAPTTLYSSSSPTIVGNTLYTEHTCNNCALKAYDTSTGTVRWSSSTFPSGIRETSVVDGVVYAGSDDWNLRAFDAATGNVLWTTPLIGGIVTAPVVDNGKVFVGVFAGHLFALDASTGAILWEAGSFWPSTGGVNSSPTVASGKIYVGTSDGYVNAVDETTGALIWTSARMTDSIWSTLALANGVLYGQDLAGRVFALSASTGATKWTYQTGATPSSVRGATAAVAGGVVYMGSSDGKFYAFDAISGAVLWSYQTGGPILSSPAISNGMVYVGSNDGKLYAFMMSPANHAPTINPFAGATINEGDTYSTNGSFTDADSSTSWTATVNYGDGSGVQSLTLSGTNFSLSHIYKDNGTYTVTVNVVDNQGATGTSIANVNVNNISPTVSAISAPTAPVVLGTSISSSASFTDPGALDTHTAIWDWGDGTTTGTVTENNGSGSISDNHTYVSTGVYTITLTVTDKDGGAGISIFQYVSVYNPTSQGLFSGARIFASPFGAYTANPSLVGNVMFGISVKYSGTAPTGHVNMNFKVANLDFVATSIDSLVTAFGKATLRGSGTINDSGNYTFLVTGIDGGQAGGLDTVRFQIKDSSGIVIYDSQLGAPDTIDPTAVVTGQIVVH